MMLNKISVISIDLDDTLWDNKPALEYAENKVYTWLSEHTSKITESLSISEIIEHRKSISEQLPETHHDYTKQRLSSLGVLMEKFGYDLKLAKEAMKVFLQARSNVSLYPDVVPVLKELNKKYSIVAVTNGNANIDNIGISRYFEFSVSPAETGTSKPDVAFFQFLFKKTGLSSENVLHVGDEPETDILGAQNAKLNNVWINRNGMEWPAAIPKPDFEISTLFDLPTILEK